MAHTIQDIFDYMSVKDLNKCKKLLDDVTKSATNIERQHVSTLNIEDFIEYNNNYLSATDLQDVKAQAELAYNKNLGNKSSSNLNTLWLTHTNLTYQWTNRSGNLTKNLPVPFQGYESIFFLFKTSNRYILQ